MRKTILLGYGNPDRGDDGVAWNLIHTLMKEKGLNDIDLFSSDLFFLNRHVDIWFNLQLLPEVSELISEYELAIFIDAHTGEIEKEINIIEIEPQLINSPFTHHVSPSTCLALSKSLVGKIPEAWLCSVRGYDFRFERKLSIKTAKLVKKTISLLKKQFPEFL